MTDNDNSGTEGVLSLKDGENCPFWRDRESQAELLGELAKEAIIEADKRGYDINNLAVETRYHRSSRKPQCCYGEVTVRKRRSVAPNIKHDK